MRADEFAHPVGKDGILDPQHDLEIEIEAAHVEIRAPEIDRIVEHDQLRVHLARHEFPHPRPAFQEVVIERARRPDGGVIVGFPGHHQPRIPLARDAADAFHQPPRG
ncbi:hypothetical protein JD971_06065 [Croceicoccus sp. YJ47]|nr:hypothetical protein [Croceicoccus sp. YJ47]QQN75229.1 hypothetical protein JD971_06065 [Croceicoccus sp. YJ47]